MRRKATVCGWKLQKKQHLLILFCQCHLRWCCCLYSILLMFAVGFCSAVHHQSLTSAICSREAGTIFQSQPNGPMGEAHLRTMHYFCYGTQHHHWQKIHYVLGFFSYQWRYTKVLLSALHHLILFRMLFGSCSSARGRSVPLRARRVELRRKVYCVAHEVF